MNPFDFISKHFWVVAIIVTIINWLIFRDGAETLVQYPGAIEFRYGLKSKDITNPAVITALWLLVLPFGIFGVAIMCSIEIPIPTFR